MATKAFKSEKIDAIKAKAEKAQVAILTEYKVLKEGKSRSLLQIHLVTGRTHQIRAHMAHVGHPLIGDGKYGNPEINRACGLTRQALCSCKVVFNFQDDNGILEYLKNKEVSLGEIPFCDLID